MSKPVSYLRDRSLPVHALVLAMRTVLERQAKRDEKRPAKSDSRQLTLKGIEREGK